MNQNTKIDALDLGYQISLTIKKIKRIWGDERTDPQIAYVQGLGGSRIGWNTIEPANENETVVAIYNSQMPSAVQDISRILDNIGVENSTYCGVTNGADIVVTIQNDTAAAKLEDLKNIWNQITDGIKEEQAAVDNAKKNPDLTLVFDEEKNPLTAEGKAEIKKINELRDAAYTELSTAKRTLGFAYEKVLNATLPPRGEDLSGAQQKTAEIVNQR